MWRWLILVVLLAACPRRESNVPPDIRVAEKDVGHELASVIIAASGVYVDRVRVADVPAALEKLPNPVDVWLIADREPSWKTTLALRTIAAKRAVRLHRPRRGAEDVCRGGRLTITPPSPDDETVVLSLLIQPDRMWLGLSRVNEFQEVPLARTGHDFERLARSLKDYKATAFFVDRKDIEIGAERGVTADVLVEAIDIACSAGFVDVAILRPDLLTAAPAL